MSYDQNHRKRAAELKALDANKLISTIPGLSNILTSAEVMQIQKVLDAAVLNPVVRQEYEEAHRKSIIAQSGAVVNRDEAKERRANQIFERQIPISEADRRIRLDYKKMLSPEALLPRSNNPDEADYLAQVRLTLEHNGVWLRMGQPYVRNPDDRSSHMFDPRTWQLWFSLGPAGDTIPSSDRMIDRDELLTTTMLGAGYYRSVLTGPVQAKLKKYLAQINSGYDDGWEEHTRLLRRYREAAPGVAEISDGLGGARLPSLSIWDRAHKLIIASMNANNGGDVIKAQVYLVSAARLVEYNAELLADYAERSGAGAGAAISILKVAKTAGQVAEVVLLVTGVGTGIKALRGAEAAGSIAKREAIDEMAEKLAREYAKKNGISEAELKVVRYVKGPPGTTLSAGYKAGQSTGAGTGWHKW